MNTKYYMVIIKGKIKTSEIMSCVYNTNIQKWDVKFNNGKTYSYAYLNVEKLSKPDVLNPNMYRISRQGRGFFDNKAIYVFRSTNESYWHICFGNGSERDYRQSDLHITESRLNHNQSANVFEYIKQIAGLSDIKNEDTGEKLLFNFLTKKRVQNEIVKIKEVFNMVIRLLNFKMDENEILDMIEVVLKRFRLYELRQNMNKILVLYFGSSFILLNHLLEI